MHFFIIFKSLTFLIIETNALQTSHRGPYTPVKYCTSYDSNSYSWHSITPTECCYAKAALWHRHDSTEKQFHGYKKQSQEMPLKKHTVKTILVHFTTTTAYNTKQGQRDVVLESSAKQ